MNPWTIPAPAPITRTTANGYTSFSNLIFSSYYASNFDYQYSSNISSTQVTNANFYDFADTRLTIGDRGIGMLNYVLTEVEANVRLNTGYYYFMLDLQNEVTTDLLIGKNTDRNLDEYANVANYYGDLLNNPSANITHPKNMTTMYPIHIPEGYYRFYLRMFRTIANRNNKYFIPKYYYTSTWTSQSYSLNSSNEMAYMPYNILPPAYQTGSVNFNNLYFVNNTVTGATSNLYVYEYIIDNVLVVGSYNSYGIFGINSYSSVSTPTQVLGVNGSGFISKIIKVATSSMTSLFLKSDGTVYSCGDNTYGQLGLNITTLKISTLQQVLGVNGSGYISGIIDCDCRGYHSLFVNRDGTVYSCGYNSEGQLGIGTTSPSSTPVNCEISLKQVLNISDIIQVSTNRDWSMFLKRDGTVYTCGNNTNGQLGLNNVSRQTTPQQVLGVNGSGYIAGIAKVSAGELHSLFLEKNDGVTYTGKVYSCGRNYSGQLGIGTTGTGFEKTLKQVLGIDNVIDISANLSYSMFLKSNKTAYVCGDNNSRMLGLGVANPTFFTSLQQAKDIDGSTFLTNIKKIYAGGAPTYLKNDGIYCLILSSGVYYLNKKYDTIASDIIDIVADGGGSDPTHFMIYNKKNYVNVSNYTYNIPHSNVQNTFFAGITSNNVRIQDFRIYPANSANDILYTASNNLYYGLNPPSEYTITSNVVVKAVRWLESPNYASTTYSPFNRYITYNDTGDIGIGIGKSSVPDATLDIFTGDPSLYSIKTNNPIWVQSGVVASSDRRIKTNIRDFDANAALNQILSIQPKTYNYIDKHRTDDTIIGFSAQQIKEVIPNAVTLNTEVIPNIQSTAYLQDNCIYLIDTVDISEKIYPMDTVVLEYNNSRYYERATEILNASSFKIENKSNIPNTSLFVYGTYVKDFHSLDKNYIYTLSVCATQDIHKKQEALYQSINTFIDNLDTQSLDHLSSNIMKIKSQASSNISYENLLEIRAKLSSIEGMDLSIQTSNLYIIDDILQNNSSILSKNQAIINNSDLYMTSTNNLDANIDKINDILQRNNLA
jgi:alpha-tubulin suppressor-like RCC1 family protein